MSDALTKAKDPDSEAEALRRLANDASVQVVRAVARNPSTNGATLRLLATHADEQVRVSVAFHPHTPLDVLTELAARPDAGISVDEGPLEPGWFDSIHGRLIERMKWSPEPKLLNALSEDVTSSGRKSGRVVECARRLRAFHNVDRVRALRVAERVRYANPGRRGGVAVECITALATDPEVSVRIAVARSFRTPPHLRRHLATDEDIEVRLVVAGHPRTPEDVLNALWKSHGPGGRVASRIASNPSITSELLERILNEAGDPAVLATVARHSAIGPESQRTLMATGNWSIQRALARNKQTLPELLALLSQHEDRDLRASVARNGSAPANALRELANDENVDVRLALAGRGRNRIRREPPLSREVCQVLAKDPDLRVRKRLLTRHDLPLEKEEREHLRREMKRLEKTLQVLGHPDFPLSNAPRHERRHPRSVSLSHAVCLHLEELDALIADHSEFLGSGGGGGQWHQMLVGSRVLATYLFDGECTGKQLRLASRRIPSSLDLGKRDLRFSNLANCVCEDVDFTDSLLEGSVAVDGIWTRANFAGADLRSVDFSGSCLRNACFEGADLRGADFECADCTGAKFRGAQLAGSRWPSAILDGIER